MGRKPYTDEFLINELHRFVDEFGFVPTAPDMDAAEGYPSVFAYKNHFKTWNNALIIAGLEINNKYHSEKLDGSETCNYCGKKADEIPNFTSWKYDEEGIRYCNKHGQGQDYVIGELDINSTVGRGRAGEILVTKVLKIKKEHDYNRKTCQSIIDLYNDEYGKIDVKIALYSFDYNKWYFTFKAKKDAKTYICVGLSNNRSNVEHVWVIPNEGKIRNKTGITITNSYRGLANRKHWEVDSEPYNDTWKNMSLNNCNSMIDKSKVETEEEKRKHEKFKKAYFKKLGIKE